MQEEALNKFFESNKWDTYSCYDIFKRLYSNIIALIRYNGSEKKTKGSPLKHCWGARVVFRTDRDPLCQILDIIRFNDPPPPDASVPPVPSPVYQAVHHGPCRVSSGCCHGGSLSSSLTSATLFSVRNDYIHTYIHIYTTTTTTRESPSCDGWFRGTTASPGPLWARSRVYTGWFRRIDQFSTRYSRVGISRAIVPSGDIFDEEGK